MAFGFGLASRFKMNALTSNCLAHRRNLRASSRRSSGVNTDTSASNSGSSLTLNFSPSFIRPDRCPVTWTKAVHVNNFFQIPHDAEFKYFLINKQNVTHPRRVL